MNRKSTERENLIDPDLVGWLVFNGTFSTNRPYEYEIHCVRPGDKKNA